MNYENINPKTPSQETRPRLPEQPTETLGALALEAENPPKETRQEISQETMESMAEYQELQEANKLLDAAIEAVEEAKKEVIRTYDAFVKAREEIEGSPTRPRPADYIEEEQRATFLNEVSQLEKRLGGNPFIEAVEEAREAREEIESQPQPEINTQPLTAEELEALAAEELGDLCVYVSGHDIEIKVDDISPELQALNQERTETWKTYAQARENYRTALETRTNHLEAKQEEKEAFAAYQRAHDTVQAALKTATVTARVSEMVRASG